MRSLLAVAVAVTACVAAACSLGALDGFSGGEPADAGVDGNDADGGASADASADGLADAGDSAGAKRFCQTLTDPATACLDFDDGQLPLSFATKNNVATALVDAFGKDGTKGLTVTVPANAPNNAAACIWMDFVGARTGMTLEADVRIASTGTQNFDIVNLFSAADRELGLSVTGATLFIEEERPASGGGVTELLKPASVPPKNTFQRLRFVMTVDGEMARTELFVDGVSALTHDTLATNMNGATEVQIGDCNLAGAAGWTVHYDNVVIYETR